MGGAQKFMLRTEDILEKSLKHKKLPLWNIYSHINGLYQIFQAKSTLFNNFLQFSKSQLIVYAAYKPHFSGRTKYFFIFIFFTFSFPFL